MAYSEALAARIRALLDERADVSERKMFGGIGFMVAGKMACGVIADELMVRVGPEAYEAALAEPHVRPMDFTGRPMRGWVYVGVPGVTSDADLARWVQRGAAFASTDAEE